MTNRTSLEVSLCRMGFPSTLQHDGSAWRRLSPQEVPPAGTVVRFINPGLHLTGEGEVVEPEFGDEGDVPHLVPWKGIISGPVDAGQVALAGIIGSAQTGGLPSTQTQYLMHPFWMLYVQEEKKL